MILSLSLFQIERDDKVVRKVCGQENTTELAAKPVITKGNKVTLIFRTSKFNPELHRHTGFSASYRKVGPFLIPTFPHATDATIKYRITPKAPKFNGSCFS